MTKIVLLSGQANPTLANQIATVLKLPIGKMSVGQFHDGESAIAVRTDTRDKDVFIIQPISPPANHHFMELLLIIDALRRTHPTRITAVLPYFGYARQETSATVCADLLTTVGIHRVLTIDLHAEHLMGVFRTPIEHLSCTPLFLADCLNKKYPNPMVVSPDKGGELRAKRFAVQLPNATLAIMDKNRLAPETATLLHTSDIQDRHCIIIDDLIDTGHTLCNAAKILKGNGAKTITAYATHAILSDTAVDHIQASVLDEVVVTDTIALSTVAKSCAKLRVLSVAPLLALAILDSKLL